MLKNAASCKMIDRQNTARRLPKDAAAERRGEDMRAVITVVGKDTVGIIAEVTGLLSQHKVNVMDISQSILQELFAMVMLVDISGATVPFDELARTLEALGEKLNVKVHVMHEDIFTSMHTI